MKQTRIRAGASVSDAMRLALLLLGLLAGAALMSAPAWSQSLDDLRASGAVGEAFDGFLRIKGGGGNAQTVVKSVNDKRRAVYSQRASQQGITVDQVGRVYAGEIRSKAPAGTWFLSEQGKWSRK